MKRLILLLTAALTLASCSIYHPQAVDMPLINHKGDLRVDANASTSVFVVLPDAVNLNLTGSYGFNDWLSGQLHVNYGGENWYVQAAPGTYKTLGGKAVFETYLGLGYGGSDYENNSSSDTVAASYAYKGDYLLPFVQFNIGWRNLGPVDIAFGIKSGLYLPDFEYHGYQSDGTEKPESYVHYETPNLLFEPQLQLGLGSDRAKFTMRVGYTWMSDLNDASNKLYHDFLTFGAGVTLCF